MSRNDQVEGLRAIPPDVSFIVKNTGKRAGDEVVQLYLKHLNSSVQRPLKELEDFTRIHLAPQEEKR